MMSRASQVVILCEDKLHEVFIRRFLKQYGYAHRDFRVPSYPAGRGSGESFVRRTYADEIRAYRSRSAKAKTFLIVMIDADARPVADREAQLGRACQEAGAQPRQGAERVVHAIPKWAVNTWLAYLDGQSVDEATDYKAHGYAFRKCEGAVAGLVRQLHRMCEDGDVPAEAPPSLHHACTEFARIKEQLR